MLLGLHARLMRHFRFTFLLCVVAGCEHSGTEMPMTYIQGLQGPSGSQPAAKAGNKGLCDGLIRTQEPLWPRQNGVFDRDREFALCADSPRKSFEPNFYEFTHAGAEAYYVYPRECADFETKPFRLCVLLTVPAGLDYGFRLVDLKSKAEFTQDDTNATRVVNAATSAVTRGLCATWSDGWGDSAREFGLEILFKSAQTKPDCEKSWTLEVLGGDYDVVGKKKRL
jgi:hypothetical protein